MGIKKNEWIIGLIGYEMISRWSRFPKSLNETFGYIKNDGERWTLSSEQWGVIQNQNYKKKEWSESMAALTSNYADSVMIYAWECDMDFTFLYNCREILLFVSACGFSFGMIPN